MPINARETVEVRTAGMSRRLGNDKLAAGEQLFGGLRSNGAAKSDRQARETD